MRRSVRAASRQAQPALKEESPASPSGSEFGSGSDSQDEEDEESSSPPPPPPAENKKRARADTIPSRSISTTTTASSSKKSQPNGTTAQRQKKRVKTSKGQPDFYPRLFGSAIPSGTEQSSIKKGQQQDQAEPCPLPTRHHSITYHRPLLLDNPSSREDLLTWFDSVSTSRSMPWRKAWIDPFTAESEEDLRCQLERRAYEVWISEIMLQQTRVAVVIDYWNRWTAKWPTIHDLAAADGDEVLAMWKGLGYYSRATRIHEASKLVTADEGMKGLLPDTAEELERKVPGVGRYTGGAISAIVFGRAAPMVDGNVLRVLSRQLGLLGDVKGDKGVIDLLWAAAEALVKAVAGDAEINQGETDGKGEREKELLPSDRPGRWGQALMELGSTVCQPKPNCGGCPITATCRAYSEGLVMARKKTEVRVKKQVVDIEDACTMCAPSEMAAEDDDECADVADAPLVPEAKTKQKKQASLSAFFTKTQTKKEKLEDPRTADTSAKLSAASLEIVANYAKKFPLKTIKKAVREEETLVCAIRRHDGQYLIQRRPEKGLLAGMWEFPSRIIDPSEVKTPKARKQEAQKFVEDQVAIKLDVDAKTIKHVGELGTIPWLFSHIKLSMHVHLFELGEADGKTLELLKGDGNDGRWTDSIEEESMGTGMGKCVALVQETVGSSETFVRRPKGK